MATDRIIVTSPLTGFSVEVQSPLGMVVTLVSTLGRSETVFSQLGTQIALESAVALEVLG